MRDKDALAYNATRCDSARFRWRGPERITTTWSSCCFPRRCSASPRVAPTLQEDAVQRLAVAIRRLDGVRRLHIWKSRGVRLRLKIQVTRHEYDSRRRVRPLEFERAG